MIVRQSICTGVRFSLKQMSKNFYIFITHGRSQGEIPTVKLFYFIILALFYQLICTCNNFIFYYNTAPAGPRPTGGRRAKFTDSFMKYVYEGLRTRSTLWCLHSSKVCIHTHVRPVRSSICGHPQQSCGGDLESFKL